MTADNSLQYRLEGLAKRHPQITSSAIIYKDGEIDGISVMYEHSREKVAELRRLFFEKIGIQFKTNQHPRLDLHQLNIYEMFSRELIKKIIKCLEQHLDTTSYCWVAPNKHVQTDLIVDGQRCICVDLSFVPDKFPKAQRRLASLMGTPLDHPFFNQRLARRELKTSIVQSLQSMSITGNTFEQIRDILENDPKFTEEVFVGYQVCVPKVLFKYFSANLTNIFADC